jgi:hypothetical protein
MQGGGQVGAEGAKAIAEVLKDNTSVLAREFLILCYL